MFMKKVLPLIVFFCCAVSCISAQGNKSLFLEFGGNGIGFSLNFDSRFNKVENGLGMRAGIGVIPAINTGDADILIPSTPTILTIPVAINHLAGKAPNYFESGLGLTYAYVSGNVSSDFWGYDEEVKGGVLLFVPSVGYRYANTGKGFQVRVIISPLISSAGAAFWGGFSVGLKF